eukprot:Hpha_TRINITY_DN34923_c0_g1::TRINITY_DN34923_c0_g1_i1::g.184201::m.184201
MQVLPGGEDPAAHLLREADAAESRVALAQRDLDRLREARASFKETRAEGIDGGEEVQRLKQEAMRLHKEMQRLVQCREETPRKDTAASGGRAAAMAELKESLARLSAERTRLNSERRELLQRMDAEEQRWLREQEELSGQAIPDTPALRDTPAPRNASNLPEQAAAAASSLLTLCGALSASSTPTAVFETPDDIRLFCDVALADPRALRVETAPPSCGLATGVRVTVTGAPKRVPPSALGQTERAGASLGTGEEIMVVRELLGADPSSKPEIKMSQGLAEIVFKRSRVSECCGCYN